LTYREEASSVIMDSFNVHIFSLNIASILQFIKFLNCIFELFLMIYATCWDFSGGFLA
jgi:hypothetical protein